MSSAKKQNTTRAAKAAAPSPQKVGGKGSVIALEDKPRNKCRKWQLRVSLGRDAKGKYRQKTRTVKDATWTEANAALRAFIEEIEGGRVAGRGGSITFEEWCERYLAAREARHEVAPTTITKMRTQLRTACRHLGDVRLDAVTTQMIDDMYAALLAGENTATGKPLGGSYVITIRDSLNVLFDRAVAEGLIVENPARKSTPPKNDTKPRKSISPERAHEFVSELDPTDPHELAFLLAVTTGLRRGEVCGLSWGDVDLERGQIDVSHNYDAMGNLKQTKTKAGMRVLPLAEVTRDALTKAKAAQAEHFEQQNAWRAEKRRRAAKAGMSEEEIAADQGMAELVQTDETPVVTNRVAKRVHPKELSHWWAEERGSHGLEGYTFHELRHTYLSLLAERGVHPKVMQELAGHSSSRITMDIYTHVNMDAKREAVAAVSNIF